MVGFAPGIEPGRIPLRNKTGTFPVMIGANQPLHLRHIIRPVDGGEHARQISPGQLRRPVTGVQIDIKSGIAEYLFIDRQIFFILIERAVFVFKLDHDDVTTVRNLQRGHLTPELGKVVAHKIEIVWILPPHPHSRFILQPPRIAAELPFRAGVWTRPEKDPETLFCGRSDKRG